MVACYAERWVRFFLFASTLFGLATALSLSSRPPPSYSSSVVVYRAGQKQDEPFIAVTLLKQLMNPLFLQYKNFFVATTTSDNNTSHPRLVGFAQVRPLKQQQKKKKDENENDSFTLWLEYPAEDLKELPSDWASLPWTKEYREASAQAKAKRERREEQRRRQQQQQQTVPSTSTSSYWELASVYVEPDVRNQGIGTELVRLCLQSLAQRGRLESDNVFLITLKTRSKWYQSAFAFEVLEHLRDVPESMQLEVAAGTVITKLLDEELRCMRSTEKTLAYFAEK